MDNLQEIFQRQRQEEDKVIWLYEYNQAIWFTLDEPYNTTGSFPLGKHPNVPMMQVHQAFRDEQSQT